MTSTPTSCLIPTNRVCLELSSHGYRSVSWGWVSMSGGQAQASQSTFLCLCRIWLTSDPPTPEERHKAVVLGTIYVSRLYRPCRLLTSIISDTHNTSHRQECPRVKTMVIFPLGHRRIFLLWRRSSLLNFRQHITLSSPQHPPPLSPPRQTVSQSVSLACWLAGWLAVWEMAASEKRQHVLR